MYLNYAKGGKTNGKKAADVQKGGGFLIEDVTYDQMYTPEDFTDEHKMIAKTTEDYIEQDVLPHIDDIENHQSSILSDC